MFARALLRIVTLLAALALPAATGAQDSEGAATLLADRVTLTGSNRIEAAGAVEVFYQGNRLTASRLSYDQSTDTLSIEGPIRLVEPGQTGTVLIADQAELSRDLRDGILTGARLVLAREMQLAATTIRRESGRYTYLDNVVASSCQVCADRPTPLWEIRARRVTHDAEARQIMFDGAQFRAMGVPLMYLPRLRMPDPTVERMHGFLPPRLRTTSSLGTGIKVPYFFPLGSSSDLTVTPYLSTSRTTTLELSFRQAFRTGALQVDGAISRDDIRDGETRGYVFAQGAFLLPRDYRLGIELRAVTDRSYLLNYGITDNDRLWSGLTLERVRADRLIWGRVGHTHTIREGESDSTQPALATDVEWLRVYRPATIGGELTVNAQVHAHRRSSGLSFDGPDMDSDPDGRDMVRASVVADWRRNWLLGAGVLASAQGQLAIDAFDVGQDPVLSGSTLHATPTAALELRWPWVRTSGRVSHVIEPVAQLVWSPNDRPLVPNEDSRLVEFDEGNLFSLSRYPGADARERGFRANLGLSWTRNDAAGWSIGVTAGRILRSRDLGQFPVGSGLTGTQSDWLLATHFRNSSGLVLSNRLLLDDGLSISREELRLAFNQPRYDFAAGYIWLEANPNEGRPERTSELAFESGWRWGNGWAGTLDARYDFTAERAARAALGVQYANECVTVDLSLSRRFTSSSSVEPETGFGLSVELAGFGASGSDRAPRRTCAR